ncbi:hypothetical protein BpHYR1_048001 [Brachionus plicatilis]|uniref:Uncharacterized protein n=1 Tax=Brachionus plicatilis TaxID=10195 RepID=A0A3M7T9S0_BRAPC|nr:hypothetical protein BpHYR1_048001 [Brachionus plicatilis]
MEALSMTKRFRINENSEYQQIHQTIQTTKQKSLKNETILANMTNNPPKFIDTKRLLSRPSTTSHVYGQNMNSKSSKSSPNVLYSKFLMHHSKNNDKKTSLNVSNASIANQNTTNICDLASKQSGFNLVNGSNQSSLNSDVFVDRLSDQRIFNRQFKIQNLVDNSGNKSARTVGSAVQNYPNKSKQQFYNQNRPRNSIPSSAQPKSKKDEVYNYHSATHRPSNFSISSNKNTDYQSNSIYLDYKSKKSANSSSVYYNLASGRNPVVLNEEAKNVRNSAMSRKFVGFNFNENASSQNLIQKQKNQLEDNVYIKSTESFNDIYFSAPSGVFYEQKPVEKGDTRQKSALTEARNNSPLPTESPAIVNLLLNNHNKLYESTKLVYDAKKYPSNRKGLRLNETIGEGDEKNDEQFDKQKKGSRDNERSLDKCTDDYDPNESALIAAVYKKCNEWLERHVIPNLESRSNTSSPSLNETIN